MMSSIFCSLASYLLIFSSALYKSFSITLSRPGLSYFLMVFLCYYVLWLFNFDVISPFFYTNLSSYSFCSSNSFFRLLIISLCSYILSYLAFTPLDNSSIVKFLSSNYLMLCLSWPWSYKFYFTFYASFWSKSFNCSELLSWF